MLMDLTELDKSQLIQLIKQLEVTKHQFESLVHHTTESIFCFEYDPPISTDLPIEQQVDLIYQGVLTHGNDITASSYGYVKASEVIGKRMIDLIRVPKGAMDSFFIAFIKDGYQTVNSEGIEKTEDGSVRYFLNNASATIENGLLVRIWGTYRDITDVKQTEIELAASRQNLSESEELYQAVTNVTFEAIIISVDGKLVNATDSFAKMWGYDSVEEMKGMSPADLCTPESAKLIMEKIRSDFEDPYEYVGVRKDGSEFFVESVSQVTQFQGKKARITAIRDITNRKMLNQDLEESRKRYQTMFEHAPEAILIFNTDTGRYVDANTNATELFKITSEKLPDLTPSDLAAPVQDTSIKVEEAVEIRAKEGETRYFEWNCKDLEGRIFPAEIRIIKLPSTSENLERVSVIDISDKKKAERELQKVREQLIQVSKMEAVGRLAGGVAHDFNNMLTGILGYSSYLLDMLPDEDPLRFYVDEIRKAGDRSASLVRQLLSFSRNQITEPKIVNLNEVVSETLKILRRVLGEDIELEDRLSDNLWNIKMDPSQIDQILMNLAVNAKDAMPDGGKLVIETKNVSFPESSPDQIIQPMVKLTVTDTGCGMEEEVKVHLFEPFYTTKELGTGLGLSTVYGIVTQNNGYISFSSEIEKGTMFEIFFPRTMEGRSKKKIIKYANSSSMKVKGDIVLVEDDETVREFVEQVLVENGFNVNSFSSPTEAIKGLSQEKRKPDLIISDIILPEMDGLEMINTILGVYSSVNVLFITGYVDRPLHSNIIEKGYRVLEKPFTPSTLLKNVQELMT